jgi:hypothetical protein
MKNEGWSWARAEVAWEAESHVRMRKDCHCLQRVLGKIENGTTHNKRRDKKRTKKKRKEYVL